MYVAALQPLLDETSLVCMTSLLGLPAYALLSRSCSHLEVT